MSMGKLQNVIADLYEGRDPDSVLFVEPDGKFLTTREALERIKRFAGAVASLGVIPEDRVSFRLEKSVDAILLIHGCLWAGAIVHPLNNAYTDHELGSLLTDAQPKLLFCGPDEHSRLEPLARKAGVRLEVIPSTASEISSPRLETARVTSVPEGAAALLYTSGTTGKPKGAVITHHNLLHSARSLASAWQLTKDDVLAHPLPIFHAHGLLTSINTMIASGGSVLLLPGVDVAALLSAFRRCTVLMGVPTHYSRLLDEPSVTVSSVAKLRLAISGSAPLPVDLSRKFAAKTGVDIIERYGSTEAAIVVAVPRDHTERIGWVGWPLPEVEIRIADQSGRRAPRGIGVLETRGPHIFAGYWRNPAATVDAFTNDGWFITGDLAEIDDTGCVRILGREKDLVISGGLNVYPAEVEEELRRVGAVKDAAVFGVPHPDFGEAVVAAVELSTPASAFDEPSIIAAVRTRLAAYKTPKRIFVVGELPRNAMGKLLKARLREDHSGTFRR
jgi:malonyl-CoA/methylmalonyl-CoA synthetase